MKNMVACLFLVGTCMLSGQETLNDYKYVIVPKKFDGFKNENQYLTSTYIKYLFSQKGFSTVYEDELPQELNANRCLGLLVGLKDESNMFTTKTTLTLKDCSSVVVFTTQQGTSKVKEFKEAYKEAIGNAFTTIDQMPYEYNGKSKALAPVTMNFKDDVKQIQEERPSLPTVPNPNDLVVQKATPEVQSYKSYEPVTLNTNMAALQFQVAPQRLSSESSEVWYAQVMPYGYQLVDNTPKVQMQLFKSSVPSVFMAKKENIGGMVFLKDGKWFFEYYDGDSPKIEEISVKF